MAKRINQMAGIPGAKPGDGHDEEQRELGHVPPA
jgi:hypothetical protein